MKRMMLLKAAAVLLALVMLFSAAACTRRDPQQTGPGVQPPNAGKALEDYEDLVTWSVWSPNGVNIPAGDPTNTELAKFFVDQFKIDVASEHILVDDATERLSIGIASGDLPDIMVLGSGNLQLIHQAAESGLIFKTEEMIKQYMPTYYSRFLSNEVRAAYVSPHDKELYVVPTGMFPMDEEDKAAFSIGVHGNIWTYRKDLFDAWGMSPPASVEVLYETLKEIQSRMPNLDGRPFYPMSFYWENSWQGVFGSTFGYNKYHQIANEAEERMVILQETPEYLEAIQFVSRLYRENLLPADFLTASTDETRQRYNEGRIGMGLVTLGELPTHQIEMEKNYPDAVYDVFHEIRKPGIESTLNGDSALGWLMVMVNSKAPQPERLFQFLEWQTTDEGWRYMFYGPPSNISEHGMWVVHDDGRSEYTYDFSAEDWNAIPTVQGGWAHLMMYLPKYDIAHLFDISPEKDMENVFFKGEVVNLETNYTMPLADLMRTFEPGPVYLDKSVSVQKVFEEETARIILNAKNDEEVAAMVQQMLQNAERAGSIELARENYQLRYLPAKELIGE